MEKRSPKPCPNDLIGATNSGHNLVAYLVVILLYRHNGGADEDDTVRRCMRQVEGEEESWPAVGGGGGPTTRWLSNKGCVLCRRPAIKVIYNTTWGWLPLPPPA